MTITRAPSKPAPRRSPPYQPFPTDTLPEPLRAYVTQGAAALGCDTAFVALPALAVAAGLIGNKRKVRLKRDWCEPAIVWTGIVGDSGTLKSPALALAIGPLHRQQRRLLDEHQGNLKEYARAVAQHKQGKKGDPGTLPPDPPVLRRVVVADTTVEKLAAVLADNPNGVLVARDELSGWLKSFNQYKAKGGADLANWLEMHRAGTVLVDRKTGDRPTLFIPNATVSVTGGVQPGVLARALGSEAFEAGLAARLLFAMPPRRAKRWTEAEIDPLVVTAYEGLVNALVALEPGYDDEGHPMPIAVRLSPAAKALWVTFYGEWADRQAAAEGDLAAAYAKLEAYAARFALVHHVVSRVRSGAVEDPVSTDSMAAGVTLTRWFGQEAERIYATLGESEEETNVRRLVDFIRARGGSTTARELQKSNSRKYRDADQAKAALDELVQAGLGEWRKPAAGLKGGQPAVRFILHPDGTTDGTDSTPDNGPDDQGDGARQYPPAPDGTPGNPRGNPGNVGTVGSAGDGTVKGETTRGPEGMVPGPTGVVSGTCDGDDVAMDASASHVLVSDPADLPMVVAAVGESAVVGLDVETTGLDARADRVRLLSLACDTTDGGTVVYVVDCFTVTDLSALWGPLATVVVVGHNLLFDLQFLASLGFAPGACRDTMLMSQVLHAGDRDARGHKLADCCRRELGEAVGKAEQSSDWSGTLTAGQLRYAALDAEVVRRLDTALTARLADVGLAAAAAIENRALPAVTWLASSGVGFDRPVWEALATGATVEAERLAGELDAVAPARAQGEMFGSGWKWDSPSDVAEALAAVGCPVADTHDATLAALDHPLATLLRDYRAAKKLATTYGPAWLKGGYAGGRVYARWWQLGAGSGRMACSGPNLQNLPRDGRYRRCIAAPPGRVLVKADYSQIELRIAAKVAGEANMIEAYRRGDDLHVLTACRLLGRADVTKADRQLAKALNFGLLYGMGARGFRVYARARYGVELTEEQAYQYRAAFFAAYPALAAWHRKVGRTERRPVETRTLAGRRVTKVASFNEKLNLPVQGTGADGLKSALALLWERRDQAPGAFPILAVHDEIVFEADADQADAVAGWLKAAMVDAMAPLVEPVPVEVEVRVTRAWGGDD
jgi:DNA polymerase I-like protein with 3'-5' exonuclease and polymerase domains